MKKSSKIGSANQQMFQELFVGTLIYTTVLGFYNDYTNIVVAISFSTIFFAAIVLELLTYGIFKIKNSVVQALKHKTQWFYKVILFFTVWFIMFVSKFVFIWVIDMIFGEYISINGFFGILLVVLTVTVLHKLAYYVYDRLA